MNDHATGRPLGDPAGPDVLTTSSTIEHRQRPIAAANAAAANGKAGTDVERQPVGVSPTGDSPAARHLEGGPDMGAAAAIWARRGCHVVPFHARTGAQLAPPMADAGEIAKTWARDPHGVVAVAVGPRFGVFAIAASPESWDVMAQGRALPGPRWRCGASGRDFALFLWSDACAGIVRPGRLYRSPDVNVLAAGSALMAPPSPPGGPELVVITPGEISPPPLWLLEELAFDGFVLSIANGGDRIRRHLSAEHGSSARGSGSLARPAKASASSPAPSSGKTARAKTPAKPATKPADPAARRRAWARAGIDRELKTIKAGDGAAEALGRAAWALGRFVAGGDLDQADASAQLWKHARLRLIVDALGDAEVRKRIEEGLARGREKGPRVMSGAAATVG